MANLFLGFPVPRAKIADMISGSAPPSLHKTQHQDGGTDEIDCTGLVGAGGAGLPFSDFCWDTIFDSIDGLRQLAGGTGGRTLDWNQLTIFTGITAGSDSTIHKSINYAIPTLTWDKKRELRTQALFYSPTDNICNIWLISGEWPTDRHIGWKVTGGKLYGTVADGTTESTLLLEDFGATTYSQVRKLRCVLTPTAGVEFWVDDVSKGTITTNLPAGTNYADVLLTWFIENLTATTSKQSRVSRYQFHQAA